MTNRLVEPQQFYARTAGLMYIITMALGLFSVNFVVADIIIPGDKLKNY